MSLLETRMQNLRETSNLDKNEYRPSRYGALDVFMMGNNDPNGILTEEMIRNAQNSLGREKLQTAVINYDGTISIGSERTVTIADSENTSKMVDITFATYAWGFTITPQLHKSNEISMQKDFNAKFLKYLYAFAAKLDGACATALGTGKTQVFKDKLNYTEKSQAIQVPWKYRERFLGDVNSMMTANDYYGQLNVVANTGVEALVRNLAQHGLYNDQNKQLEYADKILHFTNQITNESSNYGTGYIVESGNLGLLFRQEWDSVEGTKSGTHEWGLEMLPLINIPVGTYYYEDVKDASAIAGAASAHLKRTVVQHYGFSVDVAIVSAYNSSPSTIASPILKFEILNEAATDATKVEIVNSTESPVNTKEVPGA